MRVQLCEYTFNGRLYSLHIPAENEDEAMARVEAIGRSGKYCGELMATIPAAVPGAGLVTRLLCAFRNFWALR